MQAKKEHLYQTAFGGKQLETVLTKGKNDVRTLSVEFPAFGNLEACVEVMAYCLVCMPPGAVTPHQGARPHVCLDSSGRLPAGATVPDSLLLDHAELDATIARPVLG